MKKLKLEPPYKIGALQVDVGGGRKESIPAAFSKRGAYIGAPATAKLLWKKFGIEQFEKRRPKSSICSIGYSPKKKLWFGWSHRAIAGFKSKEKAKKFAESVS